MKATDLMIGDWVKVSMKQGAEVEYGRVANLDESGGIDVGVTGEPSTYWNLDGDDEILPIPITPEILEKNGFVQEKASYAPILYVLYVGHPIYVKASKTVLIEFHENYIGINICHVAGKIRKMDGSIKYVHELQHALRLCGIEKEIEL